MSTPVARSRRRTAIDVGGTFVDFVLFDEATGRITIEKQPSTPATLTMEVLTGLTRLTGDLSTIDQLSHGMTVSLNALIEGKGVAVGLITTAGFRDVLEIGRGGRKEVYNLFYREPAPIVERYLRREVRERIDAAGQVLSPLDAAEIDRELDFLLSHGVQGIAICFLHAYRNPAHELEARQRIRQRYPDLAVTLSHEIAAEWREYERTSTAVLNSHIQPPVRRYLEDLTSRLIAAGYHKPVAVMQSNGGVCSPETAASRPVATLMSGPAGGVIGARELCRQLGYRNVICADVGGTTFDVALIEDGQIVETTSGEVARRPILTPMIDIKSIGAGGGSIARLDHRGHLVVGPQSAGASPGPACFGLGGTQPTVTDCQLVLGYLDPENFLGARMKLDVDAAARAIRTQLAEFLGLSIHRAAAGALAIVEANMSNAMRAMTVERGLDPREFALLSYGGGGGLFAVATAQALGVETVIAPRFAANFSAWGLLMSDYVEDAVRTRVCEFTAANVSPVVQTSRELLAETSRVIARYGLAHGSVDHLLRFDLRFAGQEYALSIPIDPTWLEDSALLLDGARSRFVASHRRLYGHGDSAAGVEIVAVRCRAIGRIRRPAVEPWTNGRASTPGRQRRVFFPEVHKFTATDVFERDTLAAGQEIAGPAIIEEWTTTVVVPPRWNATLDPHGNLLIRRSDNT